MLGLGWLLLIRNCGALLLRVYKAQKIKPSLFRVNINVSRHFLRLLFSHADDPAADGL